MKTTRVLATSLIAIAFPVFSSQTLRADETERFGLRMGMENLRGHPKPANEGHLKTGQR